MEFRRNQILLNLARSIFEEQNNLECLVTKIMKEARDLLKCERCAVFLVDLECCEAVIMKKNVHFHTQFLSKLQSHLERMLKSTNQIDYDESNKPDNDATKVRLRVFPREILHFKFTFSVYFILTHSYTSTVEGYLRSTQIYTNI